MDSHISSSSENHTTECTQDNGILVDSTPVDIVSESNVYWAVGSFNAFKSPGRDGFECLMPWVIHWLYTAVVC